MRTKVVAYTSVVESEYVRVCNSEGESESSDNPEELFKFMGEDFSDEDVREMKVAFDLDTFVAPILKLLPQWRLKELASPTHKTGNIFYIPKKLFCVEYPEHKSYIYHIAQYFDDIEDVTDPEIVQGYAEQVIHAYNQLNLNPYKLTSPVAVYESEMMNHMEIPTVMDIPPSVSNQIIEYSEACIGRLWISAYQIGHWYMSDIYNYDIQSCFPYWTSQFYHLKHAHYWQSESVPEDAHWGFMRAKITIFDTVKVHPIAHKTDNGDLIFPCGTWEDIITLQEYRFIRKYNIGSVKPLDGWYIKFTAPVQPMKKPMETLFDLRSKGGLVKTIAKRISTAAGYGKFIERHDNGEVGKYYNPLYAAMTSTLARLQVCSFIYKNNLIDSLIHVGVDGILCEKRASKYEDKSGMGYWKQNEPSHTLVLSCGRVYHHMKKPHGLTYDKIMEMLEANPRESYYTAKLMRRQTLSESVELNDFAHIGCMKETNSSVDINLLRTSQDRYFPEFPKSGNDLLTKTYKSKPLHI